MHWLRACLKCRDASVPYNVDTILTSWATISFLRKTLLRGNTAAEIKFRAKKASALHGDKLHVVFCHSPLFPLPSPPNLTQNNQSISPSNFSTCTSTTAVSFWLGTVILDQFPGAIYEVKTKNMFLRLLSACPSVCLPVRPSVCDLIFDTTHTEQEFWSNFWGVHQKQAGQGQFWVQAELSICSLTEENFGKPWSSVPVAHAYCILGSRTAFKPTNPNGNPCVCSWFIYKIVHNFTEIFVTVSWD
jgi:hypothetical protein